MSRSRSDRNDLSALAGYLDQGEFRDKRNSQTGGYQVVASEREASQREIPAWAEYGAEADKLFQQMLLRSFPKYQSKQRHRDGVGRWARVRQLYYLMGMTHSGVAGEMGLSPKAVKDILKDMKNAGKGLSTNGRPRRPRGRPLLWKEEGWENDFWIEDSNGNAVTLSELLPPPKPKKAKAIKSIVIDAPLDHTRLELLTWLLSCFVVTGKAMIPSARMDTWVKAAKIPPRTLARVKKVLFTVGRPKFSYYFKSRKARSGKWAWFLLNRHGRPATKGELAFLRHRLACVDKPKIVCG